MINKLLVVILTLFLSCSYAQESQRYSLQEAINFALENNRSIKNASRDIDAAKQRKWETTATGLPQVTAKIDYNNWLKQQINLLPAKLSNPNAPDDVFIPVTFGTKQTTNASATLSQLLFNGSYLVGLQSAKVYLEISKNAKQKTDLEVRKAVINAYGNILMAEENLEILEKNIAILNKNIKETRLIFENGLAEEESVEQLIITSAGLKSTLKNTQRLKTLAYQMLNITIGKPIESQIILTDTLESLTVQNMSQDLLSTTPTIEDNIDYKIAFNDKKAKELLVKLEQSKALPSVNAFLNGSYAGNSNTFTFLDKEQKWFGSSLFGASIQIPIFSSLGRSAATQRAKINLEKSEESLTETEQKIRLQIASAKTNFQFSIDDYKNKKLSLELAERIEKKNQTKFFEGISSSFDLRQAQTQLYGAQQQFLQAMLDVILKKAELETILHRSN